MGPNTRRPALLKFHAHPLHRHPSWKVAIVHVRTHLQRWIKNRSSKMKAIVIDDYGGIDRLHLRELPDPRPQADEVLVRVRAAGVNPVDWKIRQGQLRVILRVKFPFIPGGDIAGEVVSTGPEAAEFKAGDPVHGFVELKRGGGYAELAAAKKTALALKPSSLSFTEAATLPITGCT